jgi:hypothetical protein
MPTSLPVGRQVGTKGDENVIPAKAGIQKQKHWIPVYTGMTD